MGGEGPGAGLRIDLLGPLELRAAGRDPVALARPQLRTLLGLLAIAANHVVTVGALVDGLWAEESSPEREQNLHVLVYRLRRLLASVEPERPGSRVVRMGPGYRLVLGIDETDVSAFRVLAGEARAAARVGDMARAAELFSQALSLWRGAALADVAGLSSTLASEAARLEELRSAILEERIECDLASGRHAEVVGELAGLVGQYPLRERLAGQLMVALYRCGRRGEALAAYDRTRIVLADQLGLDPGPELRSLQARILNDDASLMLSSGLGPLAPWSAAARSAESAAHEGAVHDGGARAEPGRVLGSVSMVPRQLPAGVSFFAGREPELKELDSILDQMGDPGGPLDCGPVLITAIGGMAGVGKTALAVHWARKIAARFPDGQLYLNLRGYDPEGAPVTADEAVGWFLVALGIPAVQMPVDVQARVGLYRTVLAQRRVLIVLDNVRNEAQVRPLLAGGPGCLVLVTSRSALTGLVASEGAHPVQLGPLDDDRSRQVLEARIGPERMTAEATAAADLIRACDGLPLALAITAARAAVSPATTLADLAARLASYRDRLDALDTGDDATSVRAVFSWSFRQFSDLPARLFALLGLHCGPDISLAAAASLAGAAPASVQKALAELTDASLVMRHRPGRYVLHDLIRSYAAEQARAALTESEAQLAILRCLDHYVHTAAIAPGWAYPIRNLTPPLPGVHLEQLADAGELAAWLRAEHLVLLRAIAQAAAVSPGRHAWQLYILLSQILGQDGHWADWESAGEIARDAAAQAADYEGLGRVYRNLAMRSQILGEQAAADAQNLRSLENCLLAGDLHGQAHAHVSIAQAMLLRSRGIAASFTPRVDESRQGLAHAQHAAGLFRQVGDQHGEGLALTATALFHIQLGSYERARRYARQALGLQRTVGNIEGQAHALHALADLHRSRHEFSDAARYYRQALDLPTSFSPRLHWYRAVILTHLGDSQLAAGDSQAAREAWQNALQVLAELRHPEAGEVRARLDALADSQLDAVT